MWLQLFEHALVKREGLGDCQFHVVAMFREISYYAG